MAMDDCTYIAEGCQNCSAKILYHLSTFLTFNATQLMNTPAIMVFLNSMIILTVPNHFATTDQVISSLKQSNKVYDGDGLPYGEWPD